MKPTLSQEQLSKSLKALHTQLVDIVLLARDGDPRYKNRIYPHKNYTDSFVFFDEAIPSPDAETKLAWWWLFSDKTPICALPLRSDYKLLGQTDPRDYKPDCDLEDICRISGWEPVQLHSAGARRVDSPFEIPYYMCDPAAKELDSLGIHVIQYYLSTLLALTLHGIPNFDAQNDILQLRTHNGDAIVGVSFVFTKESQVVRWQKDSEKTPFLSLASGRARVDG